MRNLYNFICRLFYRRSKTNGYLIIDKNEIDNISKNGLVIGNETENIEGVYLFKSYDDALDAYCNWYGEWLDKNKFGSYVVMEIDLTDLKKYLIDFGDGQYICSVNIKFNKILNIFEL